MPAIRLLVAAPLVALLGAAMALAAWPDGEVTGRDRELVARLTRGGVQRLEADGGHWSADAADAGDSAPEAHRATRAAIASASAPALAAPSHSSMLDVLTARHPAGRLTAPPARDRAPPRL